MNFEINQKIALRSNHNKKGVIDRIIGKHAGYTLFNIKFSDGSFSVLSEIDIIPDFTNDNPWDKIANNSFDNYRNLTISSTLNKIFNSTNNTISTLKASKTIFKPYQYVPLIKLLHSYNRRILVSDEVGLGKTIEAGHIALELASRGELNSLLIVCLNSLKLKWKVELEDKFNIRTKIYDSVQEFKKDLIQFENEKIFGIINYEKFRDKNNHEFFKNTDVHFDLIIFDEAHTLRNSTSTRRNLERLSAQAEAIVMLTATPVMTDIHNLYKLIELLDKEEYSDFTVFKNSININIPFIKAYTDLKNGVPFQTIASDLTQAKVIREFKYGQFEEKEPVPLVEVLKDDALFQNLLEDLSTLNPTPAHIARINDKLINLNTLNHIFTRTKKRDVLIGNEVVERNVLLREIHMTPYESEIYDAKIYHQFGEEHMQTKRKYASTLFDETHFEDHMNLEDSKFEELVNIIHELNGEQLIIFTFFKRTLNYLEKRLQALNFNVGKIHGGDHHIELDNLNDEELSLSKRNVILNRFKNREFDILLSTEVGSTGLDLQFCHNLVNYDLPWNPMVIEQRIGRIDRIGQLAPVINIYNLVHVGTIEQQIYYRLYERLKIFEQTIGGIEDIINKDNDFIVKQIESLYKYELTAEEREQRLEQVQVAIENNRLGIEKVQSELDGSFSNDFHFQNEIQTIEQNKKYIYDDELREYIDRLIDNKLTTETLIQIDAHTYRLSNTDNRIFDFIDKYIDRTKYELVKMYNSFKRKWYDANEIILTFNQAYAFQDKTIEYISAYSPLINATSNFFKAEKFNQNGVYKFQIQRSKLNDFQLEIGFYFLATYSIEINKTIYGKSSNFKYLKNLLIDLNRDEFVILEEEVAENLFAVSQKHKEYIGGNDLVLNQEVTDELINWVSLEIHQQEEKIKQEESEKFYSDIHRKNKVELNIITNKIQILRERLYRQEGVANFTSKTIEDLEKRKAYFQNVENNSIDFKNAIVSLHLIYIYG